MAEDRIGLAEADGYCLGRFLAAKTGKGCTEGTVRQYGRELERILGRIGKPAGEITEGDIRRYIALRDGRDKASKATQDSELRYMKSFFAYLHGEGMIPRNPAAGIGRIRAGKAGKEAFSEEEVGRLRAGCINSKERMIVEVLLSTGCRVSELARIRTGDIEGSLLAVRGGGKERTARLGGGARLAVERYMGDRRDGNPYLLPKMVPVTRMERGKCRNAYTFGENVMPDGHMERTSIEALVRRLGKRSGVAGACPHRFRMTCAEFALSRGMSAGQVSEMLGIGRLKQKGGLES